MRAEAVVYVKDLERMCAFYRRCVGLEVGDAAEEYACWNPRCGACPCRRSAVDRGDDAGLGAAAVETQLRSNSRFECPRIADVRSPVAAFGGQVDPTSTQWDFLGSDGAMP